MLIEDLHKVKEDNIVAWREETEKSFSYLIKTLLVVYGFCLREGQF